MKLIFILAVVFFEIFLIHFLEIVEVVGTFGVHALVNDEVLSILFRNQGVVAVGTFERQFFTETILVRREQGLADLAHELALPTVVAVKVDVRRLARRTRTVFWNVAFRATIDGLDRLAVLPGVVGI